MKGASQEYILGIQMDGKLGDQVCQSIDALEIIRAIPKTLVDTSKTIEPMQYGTKAIIMLK